MTEKQSYLGVIGGTGLDQIEHLVIERREVMQTPFGEPSAPLTFGRLNGQPLVFLPRHGAGHRLPPHCINYRANVWAMREAGIRQVVGVNAVGGITLAMGPEVICIPDQVIDYTHGREHTFFGTEGEQVTHIDFTDPYCEDLRQRFLQGAKRLGRAIEFGGVYGATQGPRLESSAEIERLERDGCDLVGMTGMPEAALAKELGLCYACCALVVNWGAGKTDGPITMAEISANLEKGMVRVLELIATS